MRVQSSEGNNRRPRPAKKILQMVLSWLLGCGLLFSSSLYALEKLSPIPMAQDLLSDARQQQEHPKVILLYVSAPHCPYCKRLEEEIIHPLLKSGDYKDKLILRKIDWHSKDTLVDFSGNKTTPELFLRNYDIRITPTLLFLDQKGRELHSRLLGYRGGEFYWFYFDAAVKKSNSKLAKIARITKLFQL